jgi:hypothetical protein
MDVRPAIKEEDMGVAGFWSQSIVASQLRMLLRRWLCNHSAPPAELPMLISVYTGFLASLISESDHEASAQEVGLISIGPDDVLSVDASCSIVKLKLMRSELTDLGRALREAPNQVDAANIRSAIDNLQGLQLLPAHR